VPKCVIWRAKFVLKPYPYAPSKARRLETACQYFTVKSTGTYIWEDRDAFEGFFNSELFSMAGSIPALANIVSKDFDVIEGPTRVTRGL
jgi:hypothetical protein